MRTPQQIENLRRVFVHIFGPFSLVVTSATIDAWADMLQGQIDNLKISWEVQVRMQDNMTVEWSDIKKEMTGPVHCTLPDITRKCHELLEKYPLIFSIQITDSETPTNKYIFDRDSKGD